MATKKSTTQARKASTSYSKSGSSRNVKYSKPLAKQKEKIKLPTRLVTSTIIAALFVVSLNGRAKMIGGGDIWQ